MKLTKPNNGAACINGSPRRLCPPKVIKQLLPDLPLKETKRFEKMVDNLDIKKSPEKRGRLKKLLKILLPHIGLNILVLLYMSTGALILMSIEREYELSRRHEKLSNVTKIYEAILKQTEHYCTNGSEQQNNEQVQKTITLLLTELSKTHEYDDRFGEDDQLWTNDPSQIRSRWTFQAALLYALTILCTTGYDHVSPLTDAGRIFAVCFGLMGIPLMFIAAADIGKFLSEIVSKSYSKLLTLGRFTKGKLEKLMQLKNRWQNEDSSSGKIPLAEDSSGPYVSSTKETKLSLTSDSDSLFNVKPIGNENRLELPILAYFGIILGYCSIGSLLFNSFEQGTVWSFIHGFFFSFNTITTIGLGNVMVSNNFYLCLIVVYCIVGLAVITMCVDLASAHLKMLFTKLHYFGRKFRGAGDTFLMAMSDDIKEALRLLVALKRARPAGRSGRITLEDIKTFLEIELQQRAQPFTPLTIENLRFVDEEEDSLRSPTADGLSGGGPSPLLLCNDAVRSKLIITPRKLKRAVASTNEA